MSATTLSGRRDARAPPSNKTASAWAAFTTIRIRISASAAASAAVVARLPPAFSRASRALALRSYPVTANPFVDHPHAGAQAADAGAGGTGQQDGPHRLGCDGER